MLRTIVLNQMVLPGKRVHPLAIALELALMVDGVVSRLPVAVDVGLARVPFRRETSHWVGAGRVVAPECGTIVFRRGSETGGFGDPVGGLGGLALWTALCVFRRAVSSVAFGDGVWA